MASKLDFDCCFGADCDVSRGVRRGGLGFLWRAESMVVLRSFLSNHIDMMIVG